MTGRPVFSLVHLLLAGMLCIMTTATLRAAEDDKPKEKEFIAIYQKPFPVVWKTIRQTILGSGCLIEHEKFTEPENGQFYKGKISSVFCVFSTGVDTTYDTMEKYSKEVPYIRGGSWESARVQYIFIVTEKEDHSVQVHLKTEISGFEGFVTNHFHYFESNGVLDQQMMDRLSKAVETAKED